MWTAVVLAGVGCYLLKLAGLSLPDAGARATPRSSGWPT